MGKRVRGFDRDNAMRFEIARKEAALNMRIPAAWLDAIKAKAASKGLPCSRYVRMLLEADIARSR
ncbi:CopG family antitoxin [Thiomonas sp. FB-6]|uniref:CopG family antitoxin n=1 Tax=Thiomonas sp. FB-6 TaxID=1158291 RepID=UPI0003A4B1DC|nr:CopG family antitoxin [Thiomonas sp. FB-6]